jgi:hypothetical protein
MFLFTTPPVRDSAPASPVVDAIRAGAERTGARFDYLLATAQRESALDPNARARTSSASGLFQFIEQTWLGVMRSDGARNGYADQAKAIRQQPDGTLTVDDPAARQAILNLRHDPKAAAVMAGALTQRNREHLAGEIDREPTQADLYAAHFLGARGAAELIKTAQASPGRPAAIDFPDAAAANRSIFYDRSGRPRGAGEVYALLSASHGAKAAGGQQQAGPNAAPAFAPDRPVAFARADGPAFHGMFQSESRRGPISEAVAKLWRTGGDPGPRTAALGGWFPSSTGAPAAPPAEPAPAAAAPATNAPLPPARPPEFGGRAEPAPAAAGPAPSGAARGPVDLTAFMKWRRP